MDIKGNKFQIGVKVRVVNDKSSYHARTGTIQGLVSYVGSAMGVFGGPPDSRGWKVLFDWPLGGLSGSGILREDELEVLN